MNPEIFLRPDPKVSSSMQFSLVHEIGHAFGLADTYVGSRKRATSPRISTGGLKRTLGRQPPSVMASVDIGGRFGIGHYLVRTISAVLSGSTSIFSVT